MTTEFEPVTSICGFVGARQGSTGVPNKNLIEIEGVPLYLIALRKLRLAGLEKIVFSSDSMEMLDRAAGDGFLTIHRPPTFSGPASLICEELRRLRDNGVLTEDYVLSLPPTAPLIDVQSLVHSITIVGQDPTVTGIVAARPWSGESPLLAMSMDHADEVSYVAREGLTKYPRQARPPVFRNTGCFYLRKSTNLASESFAFFKNSNWLGSKIRLVEISPDESLNIDTPSDLKALDEKGIVYRLVK